MDDDTEGLPHIIGRLLQPVTIELHAAWHLVRRAAWRSPPEIQTSEPLPRWSILSQMVHPFADGLGTTDSIFSGF